VSPGGKLLVLSAPSGAGKTTIARALVAHDPRVRFSVSYTTRPPRGAERDGHDYFFVSEAQFQRMIAAEAFLEYARVFDHHYGTGRAHVEQLRAAGDSVILDIDWQGARQVRERVPDAITVFIFPPSLAELERRLRQRGTDSEANIARRMRAAHAEMSHWREFEYLLINEDAERAAAELAGILAGRGDPWRSEACAEAADRILAGSA
jgi:guanylate kinase